MVRIVGIKRQVLVNISYITDFSYAWLAIEDYLPIMQEEITKAPRVVLSLKTVFLKLASIMNLPLIRIIESGSDDLRSVAQYYSGELVKFVKNVLQVIPKKIFSLLEEIQIVFQGDGTYNIKEFETKVIKDNLKDYAHFEERFKLAKLTHEISVFTEGMLVLDNVLMGVIEIEPKEILIDGLRKELGRYLAQLLHDGFLFNQKKAPVQQDELKMRLQNLKDKITGLKRSIDYIQDFLNVYGDKIWHEEISRIYSFAVEKEATTLVNKKYNTSEIEAQESYYVPKFIPVDPNDFTFMGRVLRHITESLSQGFYLDSLSSWYDMAGKQIFGLRYVHFVQEYLGATFLQGLDKLIVYNIVSELKKFQRNYGLYIGGGGISEEKRAKGKKQVHQLIQELARFDAEVSKNFGSLTPHYAKRYGELTKQISPIQMLEF
mmetsp:Transcript_36878/g.35601  ORF Transcript_36878/g.35601 Transcript_36878/m.35601 type:complete len:432 (+) Transcript_36878:1676-2971(+)